jgi:hypothetical protein
MEYTQAAINSIVTLDAEFIWHGVAKRFYPIVSKRVFTDFKRAIAVVKPMLNGLCQQQSQAFDQVEIKGHGQSL